MTAEAEEFRASSMPSRSAREDRVIRRIGAARFRRRRRSHLLRAHLVALTITIRR